MSAKTALNVHTESMAWTESPSQRSEPPLFDAGGSWGSDAAVSYAAAAIAAVSATVHSEEGRAPSPSLLHTRAGVCPQPLLEEYIPRVWRFAPPAGRILSTRCCLARVCTPSPRCPRRPDIPATALRSPSTSSLPTSLQVLGVPRRLSTTGFT